MRLAFSLDTKETPELFEVGGKGLSLILMSQQGWPVPPGFVLTAAFFKTWLELVENSTEWKIVLQSGLGDLKRNCDVVKKMAMGFKLDDQQKVVLTKSLESLKTDDQPLFLAIRSSSPEEDLEGASFAGGYETSLGVKESTLEQALLRSFASCLDERIYVYKKEHGFAVDKPSIAIVVEKQIAADTSGVGFSLNPLNNCYDETVINGNFGLGESVVSGLVTPDSFVVDKVSMKILEKEVGKKETSIWLKPDGGTKKQASPNRSKISLTDEEVLTLTKIIKEVENFYNKPIDIEWAFSGGKLYILQARPITAYIPLPPIMVTEPGEQKRLYWDATIGKQGIYEPISVLGSDYFLTIQKRMGRKIWGTGDFFTDIRHGIGGIVEGRIYQNFSNYLKVKPKKTLVRQLRSMDILSANIIEEFDEREYLPNKISSNVNRIYFKVIVYNLLPLWRGLWGFIKPSKYKETYLKEEATLRKGIEALAKKQLTIEEHAWKSIELYARYLKFSLPTLITSELSRALLKLLFKKEKEEIRNRTVYLERAFPDNITIEMGMAMYELAHYPDIEKISTAEEFVDKLNKKALSKEFQEAWKRFMDRFGFRSPRELDIATPAYSEKPAEFFGRLNIIAGDTDPELSPQAIFKKSKTEREETYEKLSKVARKRGWLKGKLFKKFYDSLVAFGGYREIHKYYLILTIDSLRKKILRAAHKLVQRGRLDRMEDVFDLKMDDLQRGLDNPKLDLRAIRKKNTVFFNKIRHIHNFPTLIDSRGKILRPKKKPTEKGTLTGMPISPGVVAGKVKVLSRPDEKPFLPGEILVAQATDPGWTPLFTNAGGVILEIGGLLQHGSLVAREYGKPCIAGIENATTILKEGQLIEMDGLNGTIRVIDGLEK